MLLGWVADWILCLHSSLEIFIDRFWILYCRTLCDCGSCDSYGIGILLKSHVQANFIVTTRVSTAKTFQKAYVTDLKYCSIKTSLKHGCRMLKYRRFRTQSLAR